MLALVKREGGEIKVRNQRDKKENIQGKIFQRLENDIPKEKRLHLYLYNRYA